MCDFFRVKMLSMCPTPVCIRTHTNDQVRTLKILWSMSRLGGLRKHEKNKNSMHFRINQGWVARLCCSWLSLGKAIRCKKKIHIGTRKCKKQKNKNKNRAGAQVADMQRTRNSTQCQPKQKEIVDIFLKSLKAWSLTDDNTLSITQTHISFMRAS